MTINTKYTVNTSVDIINLKLFNNNINAKKYRNIKILCNNIHNCGFKKIMYGIFLHFNKFEQSSI